MSTINIETRNLTLVLQTPEEIRTQIDGMTPSEKAELSADWLALVDSATSSDPWIHGFSIVHRETYIAVGRCGFKGPPSAEGVVEIAYGIESDQQGKGYATEAAQARVSFAFKSGKVSVVHAHTLPEENASTRILTKCGFRYAGEVFDPEDGLVWRWEKHKDEMA